MRIVDIDMQKLHLSGKWPSNGLVYAAHKGAGTGTQAKGVRLVNGSTLPAALTVVSEDPLYIKGDYNKGSASVSKMRTALFPASRSSGRSGTSDRPARMRSAQSRHEVSQVS